MKGLVLVLMLLGAMTLEAKPKYRIETWVYSGDRYYLPQKRIWASIYIGGIGKIPLPFKVWQSGSYPFNRKEEAEGIIRNWKEDYQAKVDYYQSEYIPIQ